MDSPRISPFSAVSIKLVVLMLENKSFDRMLGALSAVYGDLDGMDPGNLRSNHVSETEVYQQAETKTLPVDPDAPNDDPFLHHHRLPSLRLLAFLAAIPPPTRS